MRKTKSNLRAEVRSLILREKGNLVGDAMADQLSRDIAAAVLQMTAANARRGPRVEVSYDAGRFGTYVRTSHGDVAGWVRDKTMEGYTVKHLGGMTYRLEVRGDAPCKAPGQTAHLRFGE